MRGQPLVQLLLVILAFFGVAWPVARLTLPASRANLPAAPTTAEVPSGQPAEIELTLTASFVPAPAEFHLAALGHDLLAGHGPQGEWTATWKTALPAEGADLSLRAVWPTAEAPAAARVVVRFPDDRPPVERTFWVSRGPMTELVTVPGTPP